MELTSDLIAIQGLFLSAVKNTGDFTKILHKGGNEMKIADVIRELKEFLESKDYSANCKCNDLYRKELESITFFMVINSQFNEQIKAKLTKYAHLVNVVPTLSQCLLANIVIELGLVEPFCGVLHLIPIEIWDSLLVEMLICVKKCTPELSIQYTYIFLKNIIAKIGSIDPEASKTSDIIKPLEDIIKQLLLNCSSVTLEVAQALKKTRIYKLMGLSLLTLLKLLQCCQVDNESLLLTIANLINTSTGIVTSVTLDVFCTWAEVQYQGSPLQTVIGEQAYQVIEKYRKFKPAKELIQMLSTISKKPRTLSDQIQMADTKTVISKINEDVENRRKWFKALLRSDIFSDPAAINCLKENYYLCSLEDTYHVLNMMVHHKTKENADLIVKCASCLNQSDLLSLLIRYYYSHGLKNNLSGDHQIIDQLIYILNKLDSKNNLNHDILLLLLRDPKLVLTHLYKECIKSNIITDYLRETFRGISDFVEIEGLYLTVLTEVFNEIKLNEDNVENYRKLLEVICVKASAYNKIINTILEPNCNKYLLDKNWESLHPIFALYIGVLKSSSLEEETRKLLMLCCSVLEECRWIIFDFSNLKVDICQLAVDYLLLNRDSKVFPIDLSSKYPLNRYYISNIQKEEEFYNDFIPKFSSDDRSEAITWLLRVLPLGLGMEWSQITKYLIGVFGEIKLLEFYTDVLILIAELVKTQPDEGSQSIRNGFKYCLRNYGIVTKNIFIILHQQDVDVQIAKNICRLLKYLPDDTECVEAISLAGVIPENALKSLTRDKDFVNGIRSLGNQNIAVSIVRRMLP